MSWAAISSPSIFGLNPCQGNHRHTTTYLQECNEEKESIGCPPELWVEEPGEECEDIIFGCAEDQIKQQTSPCVEEAGEGGDKTKRNQMVSLQNMSSHFYVTGLKRREK